SPPEEIEEIPKNSDTQRPPDLSNPKVLAPTTSLRRRRWRRDWYHLRGRPRIILNPRRLLHWLKRWQRPLLKRWQRHLGSFLNPRLLLNLLLHLQILLHFPVQLLLLFRRCRLLF